MTLVRRALAPLLLAAVLAAPASHAAGKDPTLVFLGGMRVITTDVEGKNFKVISEAPRGTGPGAGGLYDGVAYDARARQVYWTDMGRAGADDGTVQRVGVDGGAASMIVPPGGAFTPKQMKLDVAGGKMYWADREGMRIMRANLDGSNIEVLVQTGAGEEQRKDQARWCVGIALDMARRQVYWTQKGGDNAGQGVIRRASIDIPRGQTAATRTDIETLFSGLPEPIDLDLDLKKRQLYWTDRGDNTISRAPMDPAKGYDPPAAPTARSWSGASRKRSASRWTCPTTGCSTLRWAGSWGPRLWTARTRACCSPPSGPSPASR